MKAFLSFLRALMEWITGDLPAVFAFLVGAECIWEFLRVILG